MFHIILDVQIHTARFEDRGYFKGTIAQVALWSNCITPEEAIYLYNNGFPRNVTDNKALMVGNKDRKI